MTDPPAAIQVLQQDSVSDSISLNTATLFKIHQLTHQRQSVTFMWIPSHDSRQQKKAAKDGFRQSHIKLTKPTLSRIRSRDRETPHAVSRPHQVLVQTGSTPSTWYRTITDHSQITVPIIYAKTRTPITMHTHSLFQVQLGDRISCPKSMSTLGLYCRRTCPPLHSRLPCAKQDTTASDPSVRFGRSLQDTPFSTS